IAPHDLKRVPNLRQIFPASILYSQLKSAEIVQHSNAQVLIIDCIGLLSKLYSYAHIAIVGGGFHTKGLHNILEAAVFGIPVFFGNLYQKNPEADGLIAAQGAKCFEDEFFAAPYLLGLLVNDDLRLQMGRNAAQYISSQPDATKTIVNKIISGIPGS